MSGFHASWVTSLFCGLLLVGSGTAKAEVNEDEGLVKRVSHWGTTLRMHSCARLAKLDESAVLVLTGYVGSGEEWYCRLERTAQCRDYEPLVRPHAWLEPAPGGYLCRLMTSD